MLVFNSAVAAAVTKHAKSVKMSWRKILMRGTR